MRRIKQIINKFLRQFQICSIATKEKIIYLTFDDGPEEGITEFVLNELDKYGYKATFFCRGDNAEKYPELLQRLIDDDHTIGNHSYSHIHSYNTSAFIYAADVERADGVLRTKWLRPPYGSLTLGAWLKLYKKYKIVFWSLNSGDSDMERYDYNRNITTLKGQTKPGDVVLFHFCHKHEKETRQLLPEYLKWLNENGYCSKAI